MSYTVISQADGSPVATVVPTVIDALGLARMRERELEDRELEGKVTIAAEDGSIFTLDELEELARN